jgi:hypothetical protein
MKKGLLSALICFVCTCNIICQDEKLRMANIKTAGMLIEYGSPYYYLPEGTRYCIVPAGAIFRFPLFQTKSGKNFNMSLDLFPHHVFVCIDEDRSNYEFGLNLRLGFNYSLPDNNLLSFKLGTGPHYITVKTEKQASGFIFSDYYLLCYNKLITNGKKAFVLEFELGYRHISNGWIKEPNRSISNFIFGLGFSTAF